MQARAGGMAGLLLQQPGGAQHQIVVVHRQRRVVATQAEGVGGLEVQSVAVVEQHEQGLQQVVAVRAPAVDVQKQVQFGRRRQGKRSHDQGWLGSGCHSRISRVKLSAPWRALMRWGSATRPTFS